MYYSSLRPNPLRTPRIIDGLPLLWNIYAISVLFLLCFRACLFIDALWSTAGKGLSSWLSFVIVKLSLSYWYAGSGVVLDCIDS